MNFRCLLIKNLRSVMALALTLWCAGAGCMLVAYAHGAAMSVGSESHVSVSQALSGLSSMASHSCCKARHSSTKHIADAMVQTDARSESLERMTLPEMPAPSGAMSCCPLTSGTFVTTSRAQSNENDSTPAENDSHCFSLTNLKQAPSIVPLRLPNQDQTYLRCCVFLI